jgi:hypothetical protein
MGFRVVRRGNRAVVTGWGAVGILLLLTPLAVPFLLSRSLDPEEARERVRVYLEWRASASLREEIAASGGRTPDLRTARRWERTLARARAIEILSVETRRPLPDYLSARPAWVAKVVLRDGERAPETRYVWLGRGSLGAECSRLFWLLSL